MLELDDAFYAKWNADNAAGVGVAALATGGRFRALSIPQGAAYPQARYQEVSNIPVYTLTILSHREIVYQLEGVTLGLSALVAAQIKARVELLAMGVEGNAAYSPLAVTGWTVIYSRPFRDIPPFDERDGDQVYQHVGVEVAMKLAPA